MKRFLLLALTAISLGATAQKYDNVQKFLIVSPAKSLDAKAEIDKIATEKPKALDKAEADVNAKPELYVFNRESLLKSASENNYLGGLRTQRGGRDKSRYYVVYDPKSTGWEALTAAAGSSQPFR